LNRLSVEEVDWQIRTNVSHGLGIQQILEHSLAIAVKRSGPL
jgi:hypothetical protein